MFYQAQDNKMSSYLDINIQTFTVKMNQRAENYRELFWGSFTSLTRNS